MDVQAISTAIAAALLPLNISVYDYAPDTPGATPAVYIYPLPFAYDATFRGAHGETHDDVDFVARFLISSQVVRGGQQKLNALISDEGSGSAVVALNNDDTFGEVVQSSNVTDMRNYGVVTLGDGIRYYSAELVVNIKT